VISARITPRLRIFIRSAEVALAIRIVVALGAAIGAPAWGDAETAAEIALKAKVGSLVNPDAAKEAAHDSTLAAEGHKLYSSFGCPGCHGGGGGGGMCPPVTSGVWIYGDADDTLFRLVALGSVELQKQGFSRQGYRSIVAPMPAYGSIITRPDDLWKIISWIKIQTYDNVKNKDAPSAPVKSAPP
jgi:mono/diheme cytochrome c family protein